MKSTGKVSDFVRRAFPERQIYHRSGGTVRYFTISPLQQIILTSAAAACSDRPGNCRARASASARSVDREITLGSTPERAGFAEREGLIHDLGGFGIRVTIIKRVLNLIEPMIDIIFEID